MTMTSEERQLWKKSKKLNPKDILILLAEAGSKRRDDLGFGDNYIIFIETANGHLFYYWREIDVKTETYPDRKLKGFFWDDVKDYERIIELQKQNPLPKQAPAIVPHNNYFKEWDDTGETYIRDLLTVMPVNPKVLDFSKESLLAIDKVIRRKKLPANVLKESIFLPAVVGYCSVYLARHQHRTILIEYDQKEGLYKLYYVASTGWVEYMYVRFFEEVLENPEKFSLDEIVEVNFF